MFEVLKVDVEIIYYYFILINIYYFNLNYFASYLELLIPKLVISINI